MHHHRSAGALTGSVTIAPVRRSDGAALIEGNITSRTYHRPWSQPFVDRVGFDAWFEGTITGPAIGLVARQAGSDEVIGVLTLSQIVLGAFRSAYLGYYGMARTARRGWMTEALQLTVRFAFEEVGLRRIEANIQPGNTASIALVQRAGFVREGFSPSYLQIGGEWRDHERWARVAS